MIAASSIAFAQNLDLPEAQAIDPTMISVATPHYPPLALAASITGEVVLRLGIRKDGSVESAVVVSGHPMLAPSAVDSARESKFACSGCAEEVTPYSVTYSYQLVAGPDWPCSALHQHITQSPNRVTVISEPRIVHPYFSSIQVRSVKCLYLWQCSSRWGGKEYYYPPIRSAKCLHLWNCGYQLREPYATCKRLQRVIW
jgi:TonB family protein